MKVSEVNHTLLDKLYHIKHEIVGMIRLWISIKKTYIAPELLTRVESLFDRMWELMPQTLHLGRQIREFGLVKRFLEGSNKLAPIELFFYRRRFWMWIYSRKPMSGLNDIIDSLARAMAKADDWIMRQDESSRPFLARRMRRASMWRLAHALRRCMEDFKAIHVLMSSHEVLAFLRAKEEYAQGTLDLTGARRFLTRRIEMLSRPARSHQSKFASIRPDMIKVVVSEGADNWLDEEIPALDF